jgi:hypothetical protein
VLRERDSASIPTKEEVMGNRDKRGREKKKPKKKEIKQMLKPVKPGGEYRPAPLVQPEQTNTALTNIA